MGSKMVSVRAVCVSGLVAAAVLVIGVMGGRALAEEKGRTDVVHTISTERLEIVDGNGEVRILLGLIDDAPAVTIWGDPGAGPSVFIHSTKRETTLTFLNPKGEAVVAIGHGPVGPELSMWNTGAKRLRLTPDGVMAFDHKEKLRAAMVGSAKASGFVVLDEKGETTWKSQ